LKGKGHEAGPSPANFVAKPGKFYISTNSHTYMHFYKWGFIGGWGNTNREIVSFRVVRARALDSPPFPFSLSTKGKLSLSLSTKGISPFPFVKSQ